MLEMNWEPRNKSSKLLCICLLMLAVFFNEGTSMSDESKYIKTALEFANALCKNDPDKIKPILSSRLRKAFDPHDSDITSKMLACRISEEVERVYIPAKDDSVWVIKLLPYQVNMPSNLIISFDKAGLIDGYHLAPASAQQRNLHKSHYSTKNIYTLPFTGRGVVLQGGFETYQNNHLMNYGSKEGNIYAYDLAHISSRGKLYSGSKYKNESYFCFGKPVLAPAPGKVIYTVDNIPDLPPYTVSGFFAGGNLVILSHGHSEFSVMAHLKRGSISVRAGQYVDRAYKIGECGNSGATNSIPHIHIQLQNKERLWDTDALPLPFDKIAVNRNSETKAFPVIGDILEQE